MFFKRKLTEDTNREYILFIIDDSLYVGTFSHNDMEANYVKLTWLGNLSITRIVSICDIFMDFLNSYKNTKRILLTAVLDIPKEIVSKQVFAELPSKAEIVRQFIIAVNSLYKKQPRSSSVDILIAKLDIIAKEYNVELNEVPIPQINYSSIERDPILVDYVLDKYYASTVKSLADSTNNRYNYLPIVEQAKLALQNK